MNQMTSMVGPLMVGATTGTRPAGMEPGMGIVSGSALGGNAGPAFGRTLGTGAEAERAVPNMPLRGEPALLTTQPAEPNAGMYPGYPQDMFMVMDKAVEKPETYGLRPGWSGGTMGMMSIVRVLKPDLFDRIQELKAEARKAAG